MNRSELRIADMHTVLNILNVLVGELSLIEPGEPDLVERWKEIEKVTEFGYRGSNVRRRPTQGGGFGLTKAAWLVTTWGGSLTIRSEVDAGTMIRLSVPNRELPDNPRVWKP